MDKHLRMMAIGLTLVVAGCRANSSSDLLEAEMRWLETRVYSLEDELEQKEALLESVRRENDSLRSEVGSGVGQDRSLLDDSPNGEDDADSIGPPEIDFTIPEIQFDDSGEDAHIGENETKVSLATSESAVVDRMVTGIYINSMMTGGYDSDGKGGDEGLSLVIEPRNGAKQYVDRAGAISVVVLDKAKQGPAANVARWDYKVEETEKLMRRSLFGRGIHLELPWPNEPPSNADLRLFVRYKTADGRSLKSQRDILVELVSGVPRLARRSSESNASGHRTESSATQNGSLPRSIWKPNR